MCIHNKLFPNYLKVEFYILHSNKISDLLDLVKVPNILSKNRVDFAYQSLTYRVYVIAYSKHVALKAFLENYTTPLQMILSLLKN